MGFTELKCPSCGAQISLDDTKEFGFCSYCGTKIVQEKIIVEHRGKISIDGIADKDALLERALNLVSEGRFKEASSRLDKVLDLDPRCYEAYLGKLMCSVRAKTFEGLSFYHSPLENITLYQNALKYADEEQKAALIDTNEKTIENNNAKKLHEIKLKKAKRRKKIIKELFVLLAVITVLLLVRGKIVSDRKTFSSKDEMLEYLAGEWHTADGEGVIETENFGCLIIDKDGKGKFYNSDNGTAGDADTDDEVYCNPLWGYIKINDSKYYLMKNNTLEEHNSADTIIKYRKFNG